jgi:3-carboxy-cis,cis-muconate cycloisomerase
MTVSPFDSGLWSRHFGDAEVGAHFSDRAEIDAMLRVEAALAKAESALGLIPAESADAIARAAREARIAPAELAAGAASAGVPVPALVAALRTAVASPEHAAFLHWGATSQDIVDTGLALRLAAALDVLERRLAATAAALAGQAGRHRDTVMAGRTRFQLAVPTTLGARIAAWGMPLIRHLERLAQLRPRVLVVTLGGAAGNGAAFAGHGAALAEAMARELDLHAPLIPPHAARDGIAELGAWLALVTGSLGKIGQDLILLGQSEIAEVSAGAGGGSSTMPHKSNPVGAEALVTLARGNAAAAAELFQAMLHAGERDGAAWSSEWFALPRMTVAAAAALRHAEGLAGGLAARPERMLATITADGGLMMAETATFALAREMPRPEAEKLVKGACAEVRDTGVPLAQALARRHPGLDWPSLLDPARAVGDAPRLADAFVAAAAALSPAGR